MQITLTGNKISSTGGNQLVDDVTGDDIVDVPLMAGARSGGGIFVFVGYGGYAYAAMPGALYQVRALAGAGGVGGGNVRGLEPGFASVLCSVTFSDSRINGGAARTRCRWPARPPPPSQGGVGPLTSPQAQAATTRCLCLIQNPQAGPAHPGPRHLHNTQHHPLLFLRASKPALWSVPRHPAIGTGVPRKHPTFAFAPLRDSPP